MLASVRRAGSGAPTGEPFRARRGGSRVAIMTIGFRVAAPRVAAFIAAGALGACSFTGGGPRPAETPPPPPAAIDRKSVV